MLIYNMDFFKAIKKLKSNSIDCIVTSIPYWQQRDYKGHNDQIGLEETLQEYLEKIISVMDELYRVLKPAGTFFLNIGDTYSNGNSKLIGNTDRKGYGKNKGYTATKIESNIKKKSKMMIPHRIAIAMIDRGWICRNDIVWDKMNPMPESVNDRFTIDYENIFFFTKSTKYNFNKLYEPFAENTINGHGKDGLISTPGKCWKSENSKNKMRQEVKQWKNIADERGRNKRCIWRVSTTSSYRSQHPATYPEKLVEICLSAGCQEGGVVLDPFLGSGTTMNVAKKLKMDCIGIEIVDDYVIESINRCQDLFNKIEIIK